MADMIDRQHAMDAEFADLRKSADAPTAGRRFKARPLPNWALALLLGLASYATGLVLLVLVNGLGQLVDVAAHGHLAMFGAIAAAIAWMPD